jgi:hypothetical protein
MIVLTSLLRQPELTREQFRGRHRERHVPPFASTPRDATCIATRLSIRNPTGRRAYQTPPSTR